MMEKLRSFRLMLSLCWLVSDPVASCSFAAIMAWHEIKGVGDQKIRLKDNTTVVPKHAFFDKDLF